MVQESLLIRESDRVAEYIEKYVTLVDAEESQEVLDLFENMHQFFPHWVIMTCPMMHPDIHYASQNCSNVFGYTKKFLIENAGLEKFVPLIHPKDQRGLFECAAFIHEFLREIPPNKH